MTATHNRPCISHCEISVVYAQALNCMTRSKITKISQNPNWQSLLQTCYSWSMLFVLSSHADKWAGCIKLRTCYCYYRTREILARVSQDLYICIKNPATNCSTFAGFLIGPREEPCRRPWCSSRTLCCPPSSSNRWPSRRPPCVTATVNDHKRRARCASNAFYRRRLHTPHSYARFSGAYRVRTNYVNSTSKDKFLELVYNVSFLFSVLTFDP